MVPTSTAHLYSHHYHQAHYSYMSPPHTHPLSQDVHHSQSEPVDLSVSKRSSVSSPSSATPPSPYESCSPVSRTRPGSGSGCLTGSTSGSQTRQLTPPLALPISP
ncbi:hypothetical protein M9458_002038, partial [Cirrhinus mrigala]